MEVPYTDFVIADSLIAVVRSATGSNNPTKPISPPNPKEQFDALCDAVAKSFKCTLYVVDEVRRSRHVYNSTSSDGEVFIRRTSRVFRVIPAGEGEDPNTFSRYDPFQGDILDELREEERDEEKMIEDFSEEALGWYYDVFKTDPKSPYKTISRNVYPANIKEQSKPVPAGNFDMVIRCPAAAADITHALGYSEKGLVTLPKSVLYTNKMSTPIVRIPHGAGICLQAGVLDIYVLDSNFIPVRAVHFFQQISRFVDGLQDDGTPVAVLDEPVLTSLDSLIEADIARKYKNLRVGSNIIQGECSYDYEDAWGVKKSSTMGAIMSEWGVYDSILCVKESDLCMSLETVENILTVVADYIPGAKSIIYTTIERFVNFLYRAGYEGDTPQYENSTEAFVAYQNIKVINSQLVATNGTLTLDMTPFTPTTLHPTLALKDWKETKSNVTYTV